MIELVRYLDWNRPACPDDSFLKNPKTNEQLKCLSFDLDEIRPILEIR